MMKPGLSRVRTSHVRVRLVVDIVVQSSWGDEATIGHVHRDAVEAARTALRQGLVIDGLTCNSSTKTGAVIVGAPEIDTVLVEERTKP